MRKAINDNPIVQIGLLGVLGVLVAVVFMSNMGGDSAPPPEDDATAAESAASATPAATSAAPTVPGTAAPQRTAPSAAAAVTPFEASKGLPSELVDAHTSGDVVVLLVMQGKGVEDQSVRRDVESLESRGDTSVFVTDVKDVSKYSRIAEGVTLDRVPAIIVLHPIKGNLAKGETAPMPSASVSYGYRGKDSVTQAVNDALYSGKQLSYDPG